MNLKGIFTLLMLILILSFVNGNSQTLNKVLVHGFGAWGAGITNGNEYLNANEDGDFDVLRLALNLSSNPYENLRLNSQFELHGEEGQTEIEIDYAFAEWAFSDAFKFRIGRVKHPFGIYSEIYDVGTVRPFFELPQGVYGPTEMVAEGYQGIGFSGTTYQLNDWGILYDVYTGEINLDSDEPWEEQDTTNIMVEDESENAIVFGGRLTFEPGVEGLSFGFSAFYGNKELEENDDNTSEKKDLTIVGIHGEYNLEDLVFRGEYVMKNDNNEVEKANSAYLEASYRITENWQAAFLYDYSKSDINDLESENSSLAKHTDIAIGLNHWFNQNFVLKLSYHMVDGNRFTMSDGEELEEKTNMISFGSQFSF